MQNNALREEEEGDEKKTTNELQFDTLLSILLTIYFGRFFLSIH